MLRGPNFYTFRNVPKVTVFWDVTPYRLVGMDPLLMELEISHFFSVRKGVAIYLQVETHLLNYTALHYRSLESSGM
jgi:hypothetical protein